MTMDHPSCCESCHNGRRVPCPCCSGMGLSQDATDKFTEWSLCAVCVGSGTILCPDCIQGANMAGFIEDRCLKAPVPA
jgi:DnaJ-class molecular chaperone